LVLAMSTPPAVLMKDYTPTGVCRSVLMGDLR
jgi:hypothetical protein